MSALNVLPLLALTTLVAACASAPSNPASSSPTPAAPGADTRLTQAAVAPLSDLNLVQDKIPPLLQAAQKAPYALPADRSCQALAVDIQALDAVLGADLDAPRSEDDPSLLDQGTGAAGDAAIGAVRSTTEGVIPFRGWVRKLTGAERHARAVSAAIAAGMVRRAYLKGLGQAAGCQAPAAPRS
ncbi:hypothetical protein [Ideonella dechloratans]|uniref:hypothetical protein n=1 Tax=Ideonella dechloratans TaxID=36863 RepID=UPI0035B3114A